MQESEGGREEGREGKKRRRSRMLAREMSIKVTVSQLETETDDSRPRPPLLPQRVVKYTEMSNVITQGK